MAEYRGFATHPDGIKVLHWTIVPGAGDLDPRPHVLYVAAPGDVTIVDEEGTELAYTVTAGQILPFSPVKVTAATATILGWK